jgi:hypothetical protein
MPSHVPDFYNGGIPQRFIRGQEIVVKRKFVEQLARCRKTTYSQEKVRDNNGDEFYRNVPHTALALPVLGAGGPEPAREGLAEGHPRGGDEMADASKPVQGQHAQLESSRPRSTAGVTRTASRRTTGR